MNTLEAIRNRKSVRSYLDKEVEVEKIRTIVRAGTMAAGTPMGGQLYFTVVADKDFLGMLKEAAVEELLKTLEGGEGTAYISSSAFDPCYGAPVAVIVSAEAQKDGNAKIVTYENAGCAGENMLLAATELGLGSCYVMYPMLAFRNELLRKEAGLPDDVEPVCSVVFGYSEDMDPHRQYLEEPENTSFFL